MHLSMEVGVHSARKLPRCHLFHPPRIGNQPQVKSQYLFFLFSIHVYVSFGSKDYESKRDQIKYFILVFRRSIKSQSDASCILKMEYQFIKQRWKFTGEFSKIIVLSSATLFGLAIAGTVKQPTYTSGTSRSGYTFSAAITK